MSLHSWLQNLESHLASRPRSLDDARRSSRRAATQRLSIEPLEDRRLLAFNPVVSYPVHEHPSSVVTADFNNDGRLDLALGNEFSGVGLLLGTADGTFQPAETASTGSAPIALAVGDFNNDDNLDLATVNLYGDLYGVSALMGNGDATFQAPTTIGLDAASYDHPQSVAVGDFNGDGQLDLGVTVNHYYYGLSGGSVYYGSAQVLLGHGDGSFSGPNVTWLDNGWHYSAVAADLNGDSIDDFATANFEGYINVLLGDSTGYLRGPTSFNAAYGAISVAVGDVNGDSKPDLATADYYDNAVSVLLGDGLGNFAAAHHYATGSGPYSIVLGDFSGDAKLDIATANFGGNVSILRGVGNGAFSIAESFTAGTGDVGSNELTVGDFNDDNWLDIATANFSGGSASVLINDRSWPTPPSTVSIGDVTITEGNTGAASATFTLTLSAASAVDVTVQYATADITAAAGSDYTAAAGTVVIPAGRTSATFTVAVKGDRLAEQTETFAVNVNRATNATIGDGQGIGTILDNEPRISITDVTKSEGKKNQTTLFTFTVTLSAAYDQAVTMSYRTVDGTAKSNDQDFLAKTGTLTFAPGETTKTITIEVKGDNKQEANETFFLDLFGNSSNSQLSKQHGIGTILNDDK